MVETGHWGAGFQTTEIDMIQEFTKHLDEPREIGKKKKRLSSSEMKKIKDKKNLKLIKKC